MRITVAISAGLVAVLALSGCDEMKAGFDKGYAEGKAAAEAKRAERAGLEKSDEVAAPATTGADTAETPAADAAE